MTKPTVSLTLSTLALLLAASPPPADAHTHARHHKHHTRPHKTASRSLHTQTPTGVPAVPLTPEEQATREFGSNVDREPHQFDTDGTNNEPVEPETPQEHAEQEASEREALAEAEREDTITESGPPMGSGVVE